MGFGGDFKLVSRETMLLTGNVMVSVAAGGVLLGTIYPLIHDALGLGKLSVGPPYFDTVFVPLMVPVIFMMGVGPLARWKQASLPELRRQLQWAFAAGVVAAIVLPMLMGGGSLMVSLGVLMAFWLFASAVTNLTLRLRAMSVPNTIGAKLARQPSHYYGMLLAHCGIGVFILGVTFVKGYQEEKDVRMEIGDVLTMGKYSFRFEGTVPLTGPNYKADRGTITVSENGTPFVVLHPEKRIYNVQQQPMTEAAIDANFVRQLYVSLGEPVGKGAWSVRVYYKPFVSWIWSGCVFMALGGILALSDRRYRLGARAHAARTTADGEVVAGGKP